MMRVSTKQCLLVGCLSLILAACQSAVRTDIETFRNEKADFASGTIHVVAGDAAVFDSLEFQHFKAKLEQRLERVGYRPVAEDAAADYVARLGYTAARQEADQPRSDIHYGGFFGSRYNRGAVIIAADNSREFEYLHQLSLTIDRRTSGEKILQVKASSENRCQHLSVVFDEMLDAIFQDLMRADGSIQRISVKGDTRCPR